MLELQLRPEFRSKRLKGTAIDFNDCIEQDPEQVFRYNISNWRFNKITKIYRDWTG